MTSIESLTYALDQAVVMMGAKSTRQLTEWLKAGRIPGRKIGREWRMTRGDVEAAIESFGTNGQPQTPEEKRSGLTPTSQRRLGMNF